MKLYIIVFHITLYYIKNIMIRLYLMLILHINIYNKLLIINMCISGNYCKT